MTIIFAEEFGGAYSGSLTVSDTAALIGSPANGRRTVNGGQATPVWGNPGFRYGPTARSGLGPVTALVRTTNQPGDGPALVIQEGTTLDATRGLRFQGYDVWGATARGATRRRSIDYLLTAVPRVGGGCFFLLSGGAYGTFPSATLVDVSNEGAGTNNYVYLAGHSAVWAADWLHVHDTADLPAGMGTRYGSALVGDEFTAANGTAVHGRVAAGTAGASWSVLSGSVTIQNNAAQASGGPPGLAMIDPGVRPRIIECAFSWAGSGSIEVCFRSNGTYLGSWILYHYMGGTNLERPTGGTAVSTGAFVPVIGPNTFRIHDYGDSFRIFLNGDDCFGLISGTDGALNSGQRQVGFATGEGTQNILEFGAWGSTLTLPTALGPVPAPPAGQGASILSETFPGANGAALPGAWTVVAGSWRQQNGRGEMTTASVSGLATVSTGAAGANHETEADITLPVTTPTYPVDWYPGVEIRATDVNNRVHARLLRQFTGGSPSNEVEVWEYVAGAGTLIGYINLGDVLVPGSVRNLRIAGLGAEVASYLDDELIVQAVTSVLTGSRAGIGIRDNNPSGHPSWDNVEIRATGSSGGGPVISNVQVVWRRSTTARITWNTDVPARGRVYHGATSAYGLSTALSGLTTAHDHTLTGITPGATWHYSVYSEVD